MKVIAPFPRVWTEAGRVLGMFFHNTMRIMMVNGRVLRLIKEETGPPGGSVAQQRFCIPGEVPPSRSPFRDSGRDPPPRRVRGLGILWMEGLQGVT